MLRPAGRDGADIHVTFRSHSIAASPYGLLLHSIRTRRFLSRTSSSNCYALCALTPSSKATDYYTSRWATSTI